MPRADKPNASKRDSNLPAENPLFQLPSVPPWRTPKFQKSSNPCSRYNTVTPLRRPSTLLIHHLEQPSTSSGKQELEVNNRGALIENKTCKEPFITSIPTEEIEYDYRPFCDKPLLRESKIDSYLQAERAVHCLIFHRAGHQHGSSDHYRPDVELDCGEDEWNGYTSRLKNINEGENSLLLKVPGCSKDDLSELLNKNHMRQRPSVRRIDEILNHEFNALQSFWGDSSLAAALERSHLHEQYLLLMQEQKEVAHVKGLLDSSSSMNSHFPHIKS